MIQQQPMSAVGGSPMPPQPPGPGAVAQQQSSMMMVAGGPPMPPGPAPVIQQQPQAMAKPQAQADCPPGLEYLQARENHSLSLIYKYEPKKTISIQFQVLDQVLIKQKVELLEMVTDYESNNQYELLNSVGQPVYKAEEHTDCLLRYFCGYIRPFDIEIKDNFGTEVIHLNRGLRCNCCCCPCFMQKMEVRAQLSSSILYKDEKTPFHCSRCPLPRVI